MGRGKGKGKSGKRESGKQETFNLQLGTAQERVPKVVRGMAALPPGRTAARAADAA